MSIDRDYFTVFKAEISLDRHSSSMAVDMQRFISSCINSDVVIDFLIIVRIMFQVNGYILRWKRRIISFRQIRANFVTPERRLLKLFSNQFTMLSITSSEISSLLNQTIDRTLLIASNCILQFKSFISTSAFSNSALGFYRGFKFSLSTQTILRSPIERLTGDSLGSCLEELEFLIFFN